MDSITVVGNVAAPPKSGLTGAGRAFTSLRVASTLRRLDRTTGIWGDGATNWYTVYAYQSLGQHAATSLAQGDRVIVVGRLRVRPWTDGERRGTAVEIDADALGPDLRWGTTVFARSARSPSPDSSASGSDATSSFGQGGDLEEARAEVDAWAPTPF